MLSIAPMLPFLFTGDIAESFGEIGFVIKLMTLVYILYWLYITFYQVPIIFGVSSIVAGFFLLTYPVTIVTLVVLFFVFVVMGNMLQMLLMFGVFPLLGIHWTGRKYIGQMGASEIASLEQKVMAGSATEAEMIAYQEQQSIGMTTGISQQQSQLRRGGM